MTPSSISLIMLALVQFPLPNPPWDTLVLVLLSSGTNEWPRRRNRGRVSASHLTIGSRDREAAPWRELARALVIDFAMVTSNRIGYEG